MYIYFISISLMKSNILFEMLNNLELWGEKKEILFRHPPRILFHVLSMIAQQVCPSLGLFQKNVSKWPSFLCGRYSNYGIPNSTLKFAQGKFKLMHMEKR